jgi:hypothetical protein
MSDGERSPAFGFGKTYATRGLFGLAFLAQALLHAPEALAEPPPPAAEGAPPPEAPPATADAPPADEPPPVDAVPPVEPPPPPSPLEVTVEGDRAPAGSVSLRRRDIRDMPGVLGDPYRAVEIQPGVTPTASGLPYYYIRGAPPGNVGYYFDGIRVPLLFHVGAGPSVISAPLVQRVELHLGPYPASIGRLAGAAVEAEAAPLPTEWRGEGTFRFVDLGGVVQGPVSKDATVLVGGHYAAGARLISALVKNVDFGYGDYQARATYKLGPSSRISVLAFGAWDYLATFIEDDRGALDKDVLLDADFHRIDFRYTREFASGGRLQSALTLGLDRSRQVGVEDARNFKINGRVALSRPVGNGKALLRGGVDIMVDRYDMVHKPPTCTESTPPGTDCEPAEDGVGQLDEAFRELFPSRWDSAIGAWADALVVLDERSSITPGVRIDHYASLGKSAVAVDPKIVGRFGVGERVRLIPAIGIASQLPGFAPLPALQIGGIAGGLQRSLQSSFGAEVNLGPVQLISTVFRQVTFGLTDPIGTGRGTTLGAERFLTRSTGDAYGAELSARGALRRDMFFLLSYTLSRSTRALPSGLVVPSAYDRTHVLHGALLYDLGRGWRAGVRHVFYSGFPADEAGPGREPSEHPDRVRPFYRLDVRLSKRWTLGKKAWVGLVFDLQNATLSKEIFDVTCEDGPCQPRTLGPITIPGMALEAGF